MEPQHDIIPRVCYGPSGYGPIQETTKDATPKDNHIKYIDVLARFYKKMTKTTNKYKVIVPL